MSNRKWEMFKDYLHNELEISKEDIREWVREAVKDEAKQLVEQSFGRFDVRQEIKNAVIYTSGFGGNSVKEDIVKEVAKLIINKMDIKMNS
ncbi:MAG: hypothetical protein Q8910_00130 [Bacteroidota bacterium]|nr:hypothetical protein [Bacteroidota bacterium]